MSPTMTADTPAGTDNYRNLPVASLMAGIPKTSYRLAAPLGERTWLKVGGRAKIFFTPTNERQLSRFLTNAPPEIRILPFGGGANMLVRDGGFNGVVVKLGRGFNSVGFGKGRRDAQIVAGGGCLSRRVAEFARKEGLSGLEFLSGIPGTVGGATAMNAGAWGSQTADKLLTVTAFNRRGEKMIHKVRDGDFSYRGNHLPKSWIFTAAEWGGLEKKSVKEITAVHRRLESRRKATQPLARTAGSIFVNPPEGLKAWQLVDAVEGRGMRRGAAAISRRHGNFMVNLGAGGNKCKAADFEALGQQIRRLVRQKRGVLLRWEVRRVGERANKKTEERQ